MDTIGGRIAYLRKKHGYTQEKLAETADISVQFLSDIENNKKSMTVTTLMKIADSLNTSADYIIYGRNTNGNTSEITAMLETLSEKNRINAEKLLRLFIDSVNN